MVQVTQLQQDLAELGFKLVGPANGQLGRSTRWAIREFQIYAKMPSVAQESGTGSGRYVDRLQQVVNTQRYTGPVSGVANTATLDLMAHWRQHRWRCPVVIEAWQISNNRRTTLLADNLWLHTDLPNTAPRMFVRDFSNYYTLPAGRPANDLHVLGDYTPFMSWSGPRAEPPRHTWAEGEMLPEHLIGVPLAELHEPQRSTYKVIRAVSEVECMGFFDCLNAYDNAFLSAGPCHWTLGIVTPGTVADGELCGYLAYLHHADPAAFQQAIEFFGVGVDKDWVDTTTGTPNGQLLFHRGLRKYAGWMALQQEDGSFHPMEQTEEEGNYFKTWHWFYRFAMAGRTIEGFRRRMWHMARIRLRDILTTEWPARTIPDIPLPNGQTRRATIGDVYTSERAVALLLRWHIRFPALLISGGQAADSLVNTVQHAAIPNAAGNPTAWNDAHEEKLLNGIMQEVHAINNTNFTETMTAVGNWPAWGTNPRGYRLDPTIGKLSTARGSFRFDASDLPPVPV